MDTIATVLLLITSVFIIGPIVAYILFVLLATVEILFKFFKG